MTAVPAWDSLCPVLIEVRALCLEVDKPYVPPTCCVRDSHGQYVNKYLCQMSIDRPPGTRRGEKNVYLHYQVSD